MLRLGRLLMRDAARYSCWETARWVVDLALAESDELAAAANAIGFQMLDATDCASLRRVLCCAVLRVSARMHA